MVAWPPVGIRRSGSGTWAAGPVSGCWRGIQRYEWLMYVYLMHEQMMMRYKFIAIITYKPR